MKRRHRRYLLNIFALALLLLALYLNYAKIESVAETAPAAQSAAAMVAKEVYKQLPELSAKSAAATVVLK